MLLGMDDAEELRDPDLWGRALFFVDAFEQLLLAAGVHRVEAVYGVVGMLHIRSLGRYPLSFVLGEVLDEEFWLVLWETEARFHVKPPRPAEVFDGDFDVVVGRRVCHSVNMVGDGMPQENDRLGGG